MPSDLNALIARLMALVPNDPGMMVKVIIPLELPCVEGNNLVYQATLFEIPPTFFFGTTQPDPDAPVVNRAVTTVRALNIRAEPDRESALVGNLVAGAKVNVTGEAVNGYVQLAGGNGWVLANGVT